MDAYGPPNHPALTPNDRKDAFLMVMQRALDYKVHEEDPCEHPRCVRTRKVMEPSTCAHPRRTHTREVFGIAAFFHAQSLLDRFVAAEEEQLSRRDLFLAAAACVWIAYKFNGGATDGYFFNAFDMLKICGYSMPMRWIEGMLSMEERVLGTLEWKLADSPVFEPIGAAIEECRMDESAQDKQVQDTVMSCFFDLSLQRGINQWDPKTLAHSLVPVAFSNVHLGFKFGMDDILSFLENKEDPSREKIKCRKRQEQEVMSLF